MVPGYPIPLHMPARLTWSRRNESAARHDDPEGVTPISFREAARVQALTDDKRRFDRPEHIAGGVHGPSFRSLSTTHSRLVTKVDSSSGTEVAADKALAELVTREKDRCILVIAPVGGPAGDRARFRRLTGTISGTVAGDNRGRVSRDVGYT